MQRSFTHLVGSRHEEMILKDREFADEVAIVVVDDNSTIVDGGFYWYQIDTERFCKLELFDDAWAGFFTTCQDLISWMATVRDITPQQLIDKLIEFGFKDETPL
jgi:hypothetical protein